ncbi:MAG: winged helix DNA-binding protein [Acidimicrobiia bacterium]
MARLDDLQRLERALVRIGRAGQSREAARIRAERSGVALSRPAMTIISALHTAGPVRLSSVSRITRLEAPLVSRETASLVAEGYVSRAPDPTDGRATIVKLTPKGRRAYQKYRDAVDEIIVEAFDGWKAADLKAFADYLERMAGDVTLR